MTDDASQYPSGRRDRGDSSGLWAGTALFAALLMIMVGVWQAVVGLIAIFENEFYVATRNYLFQFDATTWGWIHLVVGLIVAFAGWGLLSGQTWGRIVAITLAALSATANFLFIPYYPVWSLLIIAVDVFVIWALTAHGRELKELRDAEAEYRMHR
jgi:cell division protein FtsW (lipid II flippase)